MVSLWEEEQEEVPAVVEYQAKLALPMPNRDGGFYSHWRSRI
ncbi:hypothetical protein ACYFX5_06535 [Bremerella sp. T1]|nr:hypothetical protein [Bremerella volcania]